jgi:hypothetical protein
MPPTGRSKMRRPDELTPNELATLRELWDAYPDVILSRHDRDHTKHDPLVDDGYVTRTVYEQELE